VLLIAALAVLPNVGRGKAGYVIGAKPFAEQYILAALIEQRLNARGLNASRREGLGSAVVFEALAAGDIDVYVEYTGTIWTNFMKRSDVKPRAEVLEEVARWLKATHGITLAGGLGFENAYALAVTGARAQALSLKSVGDLARHAGELTIAGDYEFFGRPEWQALRQAYGLAFRAQRTMQPEFMYPAVAAGEVDVISAYTSDGRVAQFRLRVLDDDRHAIPPYDAVLLVSPKRSEDAALIEALRPLTNALTIETMRDANRRAQTETPEAIARALSDRIGR